MSKNKIIKGLRLNNRYVIDEEIGSGGGGIVYRAYDENLQKIVVVKQIKDNIKSLDASRGEADILKNLKHPHLPQVSDFFEDEHGELYTVIEFIKGRNLSEIIDEQGRIEKAQALRWAEQLADVVAYLHSQKPPIIHSDIKPDNIIINTETGDLCLIDFNISLAIDKGEGLTIGNSPGYSPPEQYNVVSYHLDPDEFGQDSQADGHGKTELLGESEDTAKTELLDFEDHTMLLQEDISPDEPVSSAGSRGNRVGVRVDTRSDIYSVGATLYHMLTGVCPPRDFSLIKPIRSFCLGLGEGLFVVVEKCMELRPEDRYASGRELLDAIKNIRNLDQEWIRYKREERVRVLLSLALLAGGFCLIVGGQMLKIRKMQKAYSYAVQNAHEMIQNNQVEEGKTELKKAFDLYPGQIDAHVEQVLADYLSGDYSATIEDALNYLNQAGDVSSEHEKQKTGDLYYILANAYFESDQYDNANTCFKQALLYNPENNSIFYRDYAISLAKGGNTVEAENQLEKAISMNLSNDSVSMANAEILFSKGEYDSAIKLFEDTFRVSNDTSEKLRIVSLCDKAYQAKGTEGIDEHIRFLENAISSLGSAATTHMRELLALAYLRKAVESGSESEFYTKAADIFRSIYDAGYGTSETLLNLGITYISADDYENAVSVFSEYVQRYPEDYSGYMYLAFLEALVQQGIENQSRDYQPMLDYYNQAKRLYDVSGVNEDQNMIQLERLIEDARKQGWIQ